MIHSLGEGTDERRPKDKSWQCALLVVDVDGSFHPSFVLRSKHLRHQTRSRKHFWKTSDDGGAIKKWCNSLLSMSGYAFLCSSARDGFTMLLDPFQGPFRVCSLCADKMCVNSQSHRQAQAPQSDQYKFITAKKMEQKASGWWHENIAGALFVSRNNILNHVRGKWEWDLPWEHPWRAKGLKFVYFSFEKWLTSVNLRLFVGIVWMDGRLKIELLVFSHLWCWLQWQCIEAIVEKSEDVLKSLGRPRLFTVWRFRLNCN